MKFVKKEVEVSTLNELYEQIRACKKEYGNLAGECNVLFRGQANSEWGLDTTLERNGKRDWTLKQYYDLTTNIRTTIESYYPLPFPRVSSSEIDDWFRKEGNKWGVINPPAYDYLLYLRHCGFPSPFLDWTRSESIAAAFAFFEENPGADKRAIYMYIDTVALMKHRTGVAITCPGPNVRTHARHFLQQADYTICFGRTDELPLRNHEFVTSSPASSLEDILWKFTIPSSQREAILRDLMSVNINKFSLMPSEATLLESLWLTEVILPDAARAMDDSRG